MKWIDELRPLGTLCVTLSTLESGKQRELTAIQAEVQVLGVGGNMPWYDGGWPAFRSILLRPCAWDDGCRKEDDKSSGG